MKGAIRDGGKTHGLEGLRLEMRPQTLPDREKKGLNWEREREMLLEDQQFPSVALEHHEEKA